MRYLLLIYGDETLWADSTPEEMAVTMAGHEAFSQATESEGILRGGEALEPTAAATTVRVRDGDDAHRRPLRRDAEQLGGFYIGVRRPRPGGRGRPAHPRGGARGGGGAADHGVRLRSPATAPGCRRTG